jgi:hypothetical protein
VQYSVEPRVRIESLCYLGLVCQEQGDWEKADENVAKAVGAAKQSKASSQAVYAYQSALVPYSHAMRLLKTKPGDPNIGELFKKAESRAEELKKMPPGGRVIPAKDAPYLQGLVRSGRKDYKAAVEAFGAGLPKDLAQADALDVKLLLARAACNLARCIDSDGRTFVAQSADWARASLPDAVRASKLATTPREQADACYWQANAHVILSLEDGANKTKEADDLVTNIREAVRLTQLGAAAIKYRYEGASLFIRAAQIYAANDRRQDAAAVLKEAKGWLEQALEREEDPKEKNKISARLKVIEKQLADLAAPPAES